MAVTLGALALATLAAPPAGAPWIDVPASAGAAPSAVAFKWLGDRRSCSSRAGRRSWSASWAA